MNASELQRTLPGWLWQFFKAWLFGSLAGASPILIFAVPAGIALMFSEGASALLLYSMVPFLIAGLFVLAGLVLVCLPLTWLLERTGHHRRWIYALVGAIGGPVMLAIIALREQTAFDQGFALLCGFGILGGGVTGFVWGDYRQQASNHPDTPEPS